jgi:hypothetical protein
VIPSKRLVRLYPIAWRARYGEELETLLEERPPGLYDVVDVFLGALDAHLRLRGNAGASAARTRLPISVRLAGLVAAIGGVFWVAFFVIAAASYASAADFGSAWIPVALIAGFALLAGLAGLAAFAFRGQSRVTWIALLVPAIGIGLVLLGITAALGSDGGAAGEGSPAARVLYGGLSLTLVGSIAFAATTIFTGSFSRLAAGAIAVGVLLALPALFGVLAAAWLVIGGAVFGLGWVGLGIEAATEGRRARPGAA